MVRGQDDGQHIDPYRQALEHDPRHLILLSQVPNYLHELYVLLLPFGITSFERARVLWVAVNVLLTVLIILILRSIYTLDSPRTFLFASLFLIGTPFRVALGNGQQSLFELLLFCLIFFFQTPLQRGFALGLSYSKYSFSPVIVFYLLFRGRFRILALSLLPPLLGLIAVWLMVHGSLMTLAVEPFAVSRNGVAVGLGDLMSVLSLAGESFAPGRQDQGLTYALGLLASIGYAFWLSRRQLALPAEAAVLATSSLLFLTHLTYDYVFLVVPLAAALRAPFNRVKGFVIAAIALIWIGIKFVPASPSLFVRLEEAVPVFIVLSVILIASSSSAFAITQESGATL